MRIVIVEDEDVVARRLARFIRNILGDRVDSLHHVSTVQGARLWVREHVVDLLFLDLNLHGRDGFEVLGEMVAGSFQTIIVSAHAEQAIRAFEYGVADFVAKPYDAARLTKAIEHATAREEGLHEQLKFLAVRRASKTHLVPIAEVELIQGAGDYAEIHTRDGSTHLHDKTLSSLERILPSRFRRIHRSFVVDTDRIESIRSEPGSRYFARLRSGKEVPIGRTRLAAVRALLG